MNLIEIAWKGKCIVGRVYHEENLFTYLIAIS